MSNSLILCEIPPRGTNVFRLLKNDELRGILVWTLWCGGGCGCSCCGAIFVYDDVDEVKVEVMRSVAVRRRVDVFVLNLFRVSENDAFCWPYFSRPGAIVPVSSAIWSDDDDDDDELSWRSLRVDRVSRWFWFDNSLLLTARLWYTSEISSGPRGTAVSITCQCHNVAPFVLSFEHLLPCSHAPMERCRGDLYASFHIQFATPESPIALVLTVYKRTPDFPKIASYAAKLAHFIMFWRVMNLFYANILPRTIWFFLLPFII